MHDIYNLLINAWLIIIYVLPIVGGVVAIYFAIQKLKKKVFVQYQISADWSSQTYISTLTITNKRDNTLCIWAIYATIHNDIRIELDSFIEPKILKPYEAIMVSLPKFSLLTVGADEYKPNYSIYDTKIYLDIGSELLLCDIEVKKDILSSYRKANKHIFKFGENVYNQNVAYILVYFFQEKKHIAFIHKDGWLGNEWDFTPNTFSKGELTAQKIKDFIINYGFDKLFSNFICYKVIYPDIELSFRKLPNGEISN